MDKKLVADRFIKVITRTIPIFPLPELLDLAKAITASQTELDQQIAEAISSLQQSATLVSKLETEVKRRADSLALLRDEQKRLTTLSEITAEQTKALAIQIETSIGRSKKWDTLKALAINLIAGVIIFVIGIFSSDPIKTFVASLLHKS